LNKSWYNDFGGLYNAPNYPNQYAFTALKADGSITEWGLGDRGTDAPSDNGYTKRHFSTVLSTVFCQ
jgi:hypothetical protein